ncbi:MAG: hypothetical protein GVY04_03365 [Cyanobacteria bacterium]|jgi:uncharacterized protein involved in exopolysaccharide biosynthesis|nr:hypothetical protein [Cyanobacteria bacterium GSL.Bin1]
MVLETEQSALPPREWKQEKRKSWRWLRYGVIFIATNSAIWLGAIAALEAIPPSYTSEWILILPGAGAGASVNLQDIGQTSSATSSPYAGSELSPKVTYKMIAGSRPVLQVAASDLDLTREEFGEPRIKLVDQTSLMYFEIAGGSPTEAREKAIALDHAFRQQLQQARADELARREEGYRSAIERFQKKVETARSRLVEYQSQSGVVSNAQFEELALTIERLRQQQAELLAQQEGATTRASRLAENMEISPELAADAFILQNDQQFQKHLADYSQAEATLSTYLSRWGVNHPRVIKERTKRDAAREAMLEQGKALIGEEEEKILRFINLNPEDNQRGTLFRDLISSRVRQAEITSQAQALKNQIQQLEAQLSGLSEQVATLGELKRDLQIAEAEFSSALASSNIGNLDIYASYPLVQMLAAPTLPEEPTFPSKKFIFLGAGAGTFFISTALILLWLRKPLLQKILKSV